jgi:hypothetical protein
MTTQCEINVPVGEIRQEMGDSGLEKLLSKIEKAGVEVADTKPSVYGTEDWTLRGPLKGLKKVATLLGYATEDISFDEI